VPFAESADPAYFAFLAPIGGFRTRTTPASVDLPCPRTPLRPAMQPTYKSPAALRIKSYAVLVYRASILSARAANRPRPGRGCFTADGKARRSQQSQTFGILSGIPNGSCPRDAAGETIPSSRQYPARHTHRPCQRYRCSRAARAGPLRRTCPDAGCALTSAAAVKKR
jgi:hypothetical protein